MTSAQIGHGAQVWLDDASDTLTKLAEPTEIAVPDFQTADVDATNHDSADRVMEYISGLIDPGEGDWVFNLVPGSATDLLIEAAKADGVTRDFEAIIPDGAFGQKFSGQCIVKGYSRSVPIDNVMTATATVRFTGAVTIETLTS
ncbi:MAG: phage tail tube protein [Pseudomonadota bacterium]